MSKVDRVQDTSTESSASYNVVSLDPSDPLELFLDANTTAIEKEKHKLIWSLREVKNGATYLAAKGITAFTMTDHVPDAESNYYVIGFCEIMPGHYFRIATYRIAPDKSIDTYSTETDSWSKPKH